MKAFICVVVLAAVASANHHALRVRSRIDVTQPEEGYHSNLPEVHGVRSCGGPGKLVAFRIEGCSESSICRLPGNGEPRPTELEFVPSEDADGLGVRLNLVTDGTAETVYERAISDSTVQGGETYIVHANGAATEEFKGQTVTIQYILYRVDDNNVEICAEADFEIY